MVNVPLLFSRFSIRILFAVRNYRGLSYAINRLVDSGESRFSYFPPLYHEYRLVSKFRANSTRVLSKNNIVPSFQDIEHEEANIPSLSEKEGSRTNTKP